MRTGVWLIGALGGLATTVISGARGIARGAVGRGGIPTEQPEFAGLGLAPIEGFVFGGHDVRKSTLAESAAEIARDNGSLAPALSAAVAADLDAIQADLRPGTALRCGPAIERLADDPESLRSAALKSEIERLARDLGEFRARHRLERIVVVNLASTEPPQPATAAHGTLADLEAALDRDQREHARASLLYAYAAVKAGCAYVNFTPSNAALVPAIVEFARQRRLPVAGSDGKTGETLVKTALAPLFRHRQLRVLSWQGYNMLGDRDGEVLSDERHLESKVRSKDGALAHILGYPLHTRVGIDFVPSLKDLKTAWDFVHFEGFLGFKMSLQFTWQGCDAVLAAPLVLDLVRWCELALRRGESGPLAHLASYFKSPHGDSEHDFHRQWDRLLKYAAAAKGAAPHSTAPPAASG